MATVKNYGLAGVGGNIELSKGGPRVINSTGVVQFRNNANSAFAQVSAAEPSAAEHVATKAYVDRLAAVYIKGQMQNDVARNPADDGDLTPAEGDIIIVTTVGSTWDTLKRLLVYRGASWEYLFAGGEVAGTRMTSDDAIVGGTDTYLGDHIYMWDADTSAWIDIGPASSAGSVMGAVKALAYDSSSPVSVKTGVVGRMTRVIVNVTTPFNGTAPTLTVGDVGDTDRLATTAEIDLKTAGTYVIDCYYNYSASTEITATYVADSSGAGAATIEIMYAT